MIITWSSSSFSLVPPHLHYLHCSCNCTHQLSSIPQQQPTPSPYSSNSLLLTSDGQGGLGHQRECINSKRHSNWSTSCKFFSSREIAVEWRNSLCLLSSPFPSAPINVRWPNKCQQIIEQSLPLHQPSFIPLSSSTASSTSSFSWSSSTENKQCHSASKGSRCGFQVEQPLSVTT